MTSNPGRNRVVREMQQFINGLEVEAGLTVKDDAENVIAEFDESDQSVRFLNGYVNLYGNEVVGLQDLVASELSSYLDLNTTDTGQHVGVYDRVDGKQIAYFYQTGNVEVPNGGVFVQGGGPNGTGVVEFGQGSRLFENANGEIVAEDSAGNTTTIS